uniref:1-acylglycerol-3-phosphate O-acyltransferase n=1 Tax=Kalanchoe fedtschenkoi TaxID=63787 RepID=A0A7N0RIF8_KALFE
MFVYKYTENFLLLLQESFKRLEDFPRPFWLALFVEGTRFTQAKLLAAQQYATSSGLPIPRNVLIPRTKGFVSAVKHLRSFVPAIYDTTVAVSRTQPPPTMLRMLRGQSSVIKVHIKRHSIEELPETSNGISQWCKDAFVYKDAFLENYFKTDKFNNHDYHDIGRPVLSLLVVISWSCLLMLGIYGFLEWSSLPTWETLTFCAVFLVVVAIIMQMLIMFTESERSNPPSVLQTPTDPAAESLLQK